MGDAYSARTTTARHSRFLRPFSSKRLLRRRADDAVGNFETENQVFLQKAQAAQAAQQVRYLLGERAKTKGEFVKGRFSDSKFHWQFH